MLFGGRIPSAFLHRSNTTYGARRIFRRALPSFDGNVRIARRCRHKVRVFVWIFVVFLLPLRVRSFLFRCIAFKAVPMHIHSIFFFSAANLSKRIHSISFRCLSTQIRRPAIRVRSIPKHFSSIPMHFLAIPQRCGDPRCTAFAGQVASMPLPCKAVQFLRDARRVGSSAPCSTAFPVRFNSLDALPVLSVTSHFRAYTSRSDLLPWQRNVKVYCFAPCRLRLWMHIVSGIYFHA